MFDLRSKPAVAGGCFPPCYERDSLLQNFSRAASGAAIGDAFGFHPSIQASNIFETADFRVISFALN